MRFFLSLFFLLNFISLFGQKINPNIEIIYKILDSGTHSLTRQEKKKLIYKYVIQDIKVQFLNHIFFLMTQALHIPQFMAEF
jgi:hypothetical protein